MAAALNRPSDLDSVFSINPLTTLMLNIDDEDLSPVLKKGFVFVPILGFYNDRRHLADGMVGQMNIGNAAWKGRVEKGYIGGVWFQFFYPPMTPSIIDECLQDLHVFANQ